MPSFYEIVGFLREIVSESGQDSWDNSGIQVGFDKEIKKVMFALSVSGSVLKEAKEKSVDMVITHHPLSISPFKKIDEHFFPSSLVFGFIKNGITLYSMHTNLDVSPFGPTFVIADILGLRDRNTLVDVPGEVSYGLVGFVKLTQKEILRKLSDSLPEDVFRVVNYKPESVVSNVSICSGSGGSLVKLAAKKSDVYITGDVKYHEAELAKELGLTIFDMGHFGTEKLFYIKLEDLIKKKFKNIEIVVADEKSPFEVVNDR